MLLLLSAPLLAQDAPVAPAEETPVAKLTIHGYLTQAFANTDGEQILGIPGEDTTDYRRAAVLLRFTPTTKDTLVVQLAHRRLGNSPSMVFEPDVKLDWAFCERKLGEDTSIRVGRIPQPMGLLHETRYVGTLLPFYRAPYNFYQEGSFTSESVDGLALRHSTSPAKSWSAELSAYAGGFFMIESRDSGLVKPRAENLVGGQVWLNTPVAGLRRASSTPPSSRSPRAAAASRWRNTTRTGPSAAPSRSGLTWWSRASTIGPRVSFSRPMSCPSGPRPAP